VSNYRQSARRGIWISEFVHQSPTILNEDLRVFEGRDRIVGLPKAERIREKKHCGSFCLRPGRCKSHCLPRR
jgi:hypothetical protein